MKICPTCASQYSDDTLQFCLQDGTRLRDASQAETPTVLLNETETVAALGGQPRMGVPIDGQDSAWQQSRVTQIGAATPRSGGPRSLVTIIIVLLIFGVIAAIAGAGGWAYYKYSHSKNAYLPTDQNTNSSPTPTPKTSPTRVVASPSPTSTVDPDIDETTKREVAQRVTDWGNALESHDLNGFMDNYAPTVDYYNRRTISSAAVRADKARAFALYGSMRVNMTNVSVTPSLFGNSATVTFDKEWSFSGSSTSSGKVRSELTYSQIKGRWLITGERDLTVYYKR